MTSAEWWLLWTSIMLPVSGHSFIGLDGGQGFETQWQTCATLNQTSKFARAWKSAGSTRFSLPHHSNCAIIIFLEGAPLNSQRQAQVKAQGWDKPLWLHLRSCQTSWPYTSATTVTTRPTGACLIEKGVVEIGLSTPTLLSSLNPHVLQWSKAYQQETHLESVKCTSSWKF